MNEAVETNPWADVSLEGLQNESTETPEANQPTEAEVGNTEANVEATAETKVEEATAPTDSFIHVKHLNEERDLTKDEAITYAQKGMDYDRIREKLDKANTELDSLKDLKAENESLKETQFWLEDLAKKSNMTVEEMMKGTLAQTMAKETGKDYEVCRGIIDNQFEARRLEKLSQSANVKADADRKAKAQADMADFMQEHPDFHEEDFKNIPAEVWQKVNEGDSLTHAYAQYERGKMLAEAEANKKEIEKLKLQIENKARSTGSQSADAPREELDPMLAHWTELMG